MKGTSLRLSSRQAHLQAWSIEPPPLSKHGRSRCCVERRPAHRAILSPRASAVRWRRPPTHQTAAS
eukprot:9178258-Alexandrium_andersonii.AAC.1